jgi:protein-arginine kinase
MLVKQYLTPEIRFALQSNVAKCGFTLEDIIRSGFENADGDIGIYAGDEDCYHQFSKLFNPIIQDYHHYQPRDKHPKNLDDSALESLPNLDPENTRILSTRIRVGRNLDGYALPPAISKEARQKVETHITTALAKLNGAHKGHYYPLYEMTEATRTQLVKDHFLFKKGDRFLESAGVNRHWPDSRGIFHSNDKRFLVWVNEEDQLRIISMQEGGDIAQVFKRLVTGIQALEQEISFQFNPHLGYISSCPTNLGTALRASVHIKLPRLSQSNDFKKTCADLELSIRGIHGEHSESTGGVWDISNKRRLGLTEVACVLTLYNGVKKLIQLEIELENKK